MRLEFHHINFVSTDVDKLHRFYTDILQLEDVPEENFPRTDATQNSGFSGKIRFATDGKVQMHIAEQDFDVGFKNMQIINPVESGHVAFRTDDLQSFLELLNRKGIPYSDYGNAFSKQWHQVFLHDPAGNIIEVHQEVSE